jgi:ADP-heptose:LPS heptosyltransferase
MPVIIKKEDLPTFAFEYYLILFTENMVDIILNEPIIRYLKSIDNQKKIICVLNRVFYEILIAHPELDYILVVDSVHETRDILNVVNSNGQIINLLFNEKNTTSDSFDGLQNFIRNFNELNSNHQRNPIKNLSQKRDLPIFSDQPIFNILPFISLPAFLPENYFVFHSSADDLMKNWHKPSWTELSSKIIEAGSNVVEIGSESNAQPYPDFSNGYFDLTYIHNIQMLACIIQHSSFFIGIDGPFAHLANALKIDGLVLLGRSFLLHKHKHYPGYYSNKEHMIYSKFFNATSSIKVKSVWNSILSRNIL